MPTTAGMSYPYPASTDTPDVPRDIGALAAAVDQHRGMLSRAAIPGAVSYGAGPTDMVALPSTVLQSGRFYRATLTVAGTQITNAGAVILRLMIGASEAGRIASPGSAAVNAIVAGTTSAIVAGTGAAVVVKATASSTAASFQTSAAPLSGWLTLEDIGT